MYEAIALADKTNNDKKLISKMLKYAYDSENLGGLLPEDVIVLINDGGKVDRDALKDCIRRIKVDITERATLQQGWEQELENRVTQALEELEGILCSMANG